MFNRIYRPGIAARVAASLIAGMIVGTTIMAVPAAAGSDPTPGDCAGGSFTATPPSGRGVAPGELIVYRVEMVVVGGQPVLGCSREIRFSGPLAFVRVKPAGNYWPDNTSGVPTATVDFAGPIAPGTKLVGTIAMRVRRGTSPGTVVSAESGQVIEHEVWAVH